MCYKVMSKKNTLCCHDPCVAKTPDNQIRNADNKDFLMPGGVKGRKEIEAQTENYGPKGELRVKQE